MIEWALHYAKSGWPVFPLAPGGKEPVIPRRLGGHGCLDATLDLDCIDSWWRDYPAANVGIATGRRSGLLVIDVDPRKTERWLESLHELTLPPTFTVKTWSGGWHLYLTFSGDARITIGTELLPGIDWRGNGGYVVAAGSVVQDVTYQIAKNLPIAQAPAALLSRIVTAKHSRVIERDETGEMVIRKDTRNTKLASICGALRRRGVGYNALVEALRAVNADHCSPPLDDQEVRRIAASIGRYSPGDSPRESA
jgi:hypothetical protein